MKKQLTLYIIILFTLSICAQKRAKDSLPKDLDEYILVNPGDTVIVNLDGFSLLPKAKFNSKEDMRYYMWFRKKVFKAYPFATLAATRLDTLNSRLEKIKNKRGRKKYTKLIQKYIEGEFTDQIKKMTRTEGRILIKLIHRQTGNTAFDNIKDLRSGWNAFWYNSTANLFKLSLKETYDPASINEDFLIEDVLQRAFQDGLLIEQEAKVNFDFEKIITENKAKIDVEEYKLMFSKLRKRQNRKSKN